MAIGGRYTAKTQQFREKPAYTGAAVRNALEVGLKVIEHGQLLSEETLRLIMANGAYLSTQSFGFAREMIDKMPATMQPKAALVHAGTDRMMSRSKN